MKLSLLIISVLIGTVMFAQNGNTIMSRWHNSDKIEISDYQSLKKTGLFFYISNDKDNIYIDLKFDKPEDQRMILNEGLVLWINMDGKPVKIQGIRYPTGSQKPGMRNGVLNSKDNVKGNGDPDYLISMANSIEIIGFISEQERHFPSQNVDNFRGSLRYDKGILFYRMVMPLAKLPVRNSKDGNGAMPFTMGIEYGFPVELNKPDEKVNIGRNPRVQQAASGSEIQWIKNVRLATSSLDKPGADHIRH